MRQTVVEGVGRRAKEMKARDSRPRDALGYLVDADSSCASATSSLGWDAARREPPAVAGIAPYMPDSQPECQREGKNEFENHRSSSPDKVRRIAPALDQKVIVVTGAGTGIGRATAFEAARRGARLCLTGRRAEMLTSAAEDVVRLGAECLCVSADLSDVEAPRRIVSEALSRFGVIDGVVNNAAAARFGPIEAVSDEEMRRMFEVNLLAPLRVVREALPALRRSRGCVVNVSSIGGVVATPRRVIYGALKAALNHATRSLARELSPDVRVNAVLPGPVLTPMYDDLGLTADDGRRLVEEMVETTPLGRMGRPEEIAEWICMLLDGRSGWVTGSLLTVDGGRSA